MRHVVFRLNKDRYALPLSAIREVVPPPEGFTRVPRAPPSVRGVMNLRGRVVTVVELGVLLSVAGPLLACQKIVLLDRGRRDLGLLVTDVDGIELIERVGASAGKSERAVKGLARLKGLAVTVLDPEGVDVALQEAFGREGNRHPPEQ